MCYSTCFRRPLSIHHAGVVSHSGVAELPVLVPNMAKYIPIIIIASVFALLIVGGQIVFLMGSNWTERGTIGDSFGMTNALFSGLAFAGVVYAILLQRQELALQREELRLTRDELSKSVQAQQQSADTQRQLAQLNAYTALMTYKLSEMRSAFEQAQSGRISTEVQEKWVDRHRDVSRECVRLEAHIENILFRVGGRLDDGSNKSLEAVMEDLRKMSEKHSEAKDSNEG